MYKKYQKDKSNQKDKSYLEHKRYSVIVALMLSLILVIACCTGCAGKSQDQLSSSSQTAENQSSETSGEVSGEESEEELEEDLEEDLEADDRDELEGDGTESDNSDFEGMVSVTMLDVGQGLSILIQSGEEYMLYDGGGRDASAFVVSYLKEHKITELTYLVASHYDEDHIAGLLGALNRVQVDYALVPGYESDTNIYYSFMEMLEESNAQVLVPSVGDVYSFGDCEFTILGPDGYSSSEDNNNSIALRMVAGDFSCLMTGDAEEIEEYELMNSGYDLESTLYIVGHHGSSSSSGYDFLEEVNPYAVLLSVGNDNSYGHPKEDTMWRLSNTGAKLFRTDKQGTVTIRYDGEHLEASTEPCEDWSAGNHQDPTRPAEEDGSEEQMHNYVLNTSTMKFHIQGCNAIKKMSDKNRAEEYTTRRELIESGYAPCGMCNP